LYQGTASRPAKKRAVMWEWEKVKTPTLAKTGLGWGTRCRCGARALVETLFFRSLFSRAEEAS
jgi:hypothetical protein